MFPSAYFPPNYYPPNYYGMSPAPTAGPGVPMPANLRDRDAYAALVAAIRATGEFAEVRFAAPIESDPVGADRTPLALVLPAEWAEAPDDDGVGAIRHVLYTITLVTRDDDPTARFERLDRLASAVQDAVDGSTLGGGCLRSLTRIRGARYDPHPRHPEQRLILYGHFGSLIPTPASP